MDIESKMKLFRKYTIDNLTALNFMKRPPSIHGNDQGVFKESIYILRKIMEIYFEYVIFNMKPVMLTLTVSFIETTVFPKKYSHIHIVHYGLIEAYFVASGWIIYHIIASILIYSQYLKTQLFLSYFFNIVGLFFTYFFWFQWLLTPGTNYYLTFDVVVIMLMIWNIFVVGLFVLFCPSPLWLNKCFIILYASNIGFFVRYIYGNYNIWIFMIFMSVWDFLCLFIPFLKPPSLLTKRGYFYSSQRIKIGSTFMNFDREINDNFQKNDSQINETDSNTNYIKDVNVNNFDEENDDSFTYHQSLDTILKDEETYNNQNFGITALRAIQDQCIAINRLGVHVRLFSMIFYNLLFIYTFNSSKIITSYATLLVVAIGFFIKGFLRLFLLKKFPTKIFIFAISIYISEVINDMVIPSLENISLAGIEY